MRLRHLVFIALLALAPVTARADIKVVDDPEKWVENALKDIAAGKTDDFARNFLALIDKQGSFDSFAGNLRVLSRIGAPAFVEKVSDQKYGTVMREMIYVALYQRTDYIYFKFTMKKNRGGWLISNFEFKNESADLFPKGFISH